MVIGFYKKIVNYTAYIKKNCHPEDNPSVPAGSPERDPALYALPFNQTQHSLKSVISTNG